MKFSSITTLATVGFAGISSAARDFLKSCSDLGMSNFDGVLRIDAKCVNGNDVTQSTRLDLDKCFGWSGATCGFTFPPASGFTKSVDIHKCQNSYTGDNDFGNNFGCFGPCDGRSDSYNVFSLNEYIGNDEGNLVC
ncbi:hypothetical protein Daus18300_000241 [Diaporthe australafricana]|uniref:Cyanovirin-N domain-containing protein n=1 Tax=Diaporthe australafricana TaxID=127596 RepID=A0ABR3Y5T9_9PEZI